MLRLALAALVCAVAAGCALPAAPEGAEELATQEQALTGLSVRIDRVTYCSSKNWLGTCTNWYTPTKFSAWTAYGVSEGERKNTWIGTVSDPGTNTRYIALFFAGQQTSSGSGSVVTGQDGSWDSGLDKMVSSKTIGIDTRSVAQRFWDNSSFPRASTFMAIVPDAQFEHTFSSDYKVKILNAYIAWIKARGAASNIRGIFLAGSSRGGCLAMRLAQQLKANHGYGSVPVIVHSYDGVCKSSQGELGTTDPTVDNPVSSQGDRKGYKTDIFGQYGSAYRDTLAIRHVVGGEEVAILSGVHAFSHSTGTSTLTQLTHNGAVFYEQKWVDINHTGIGRDYSYASETTDPMMSHLESARMRFWQGSPP